MHSPSPYSLLLALVCATGAVACRQSDRANSEQQPSTALSLDSLRCDHVRQAGGCDLYGVSLYELIANPASFHGKRVRVIGFGHFEFEGNALYAHREDSERHILRNGIWLNPPAGMDSLNNDYLIVEARFDATSRGHMGMWSGTLDSVTRLQRWKLPAVTPASYRDLQRLPSIDLSAPDRRKHP